MRALLLFCLVFTCVLHGQPAEPPQPKTICLNMIVKDESEVIERCLGSLKHLIDYWVIFDTGSTDGTQEIIKNYMRDIPGELHESAWVDFSFNRNEAFAIAKDKADYVLFVDADEVWEYDDDFALPTLDKDVYYMTVRALGLNDVKRIVLVDTRLDWEWKGVLHEAIYSDHVKSAGILKGVINICNKTQGARSKDPQKYVKDAKVLEEALKKDPTNSRYMYYLGGTYLRTGELDLAQKCYEKRIDMPSTDVEETFMSMYFVGVIQEKLKDQDAALQSYFKAFNYRPTRAEPLCRIVNIYCQKGNYSLGYFLGKYALTLSPPPLDIWTEYATYDYGLLIEFANCALFSGQIEEGMQACSQLLANPNLPVELKRQIENNHAVAKKRLEEKALAARGPSLLKNPSPQR